MSVEWVVEPGDTVAHGTLGMDIFDYNFEEDEYKNPLPLPLTTTTVCDYEFTVFDGPNQNDGELTSGHNSFMGGGLKYSEMAHQFDVGTKNMDSRTLAFQMNAKTQTYIPALRMTFETETGSISKLGHMIIDFITPSEKYAQLEEENDDPYLTVQNNEININLGDIEIYTTDNPSCVPECDIDLNNFFDPFSINQSEIIDVNAILTYDISLMTKVHPPLVSFLPCQIIMNVVPFATDTEQHYKQIAPSESFRLKLTSGTYEENGELPISFSIDTGEYPSGVEFIVYYFLNIPAVFGMQVNHDRAAESSKTNIHWVPN